MASLFVTKQGRSRRARRSEGAVAVEAALLTPVLVMLVFGMVEFGLLLRSSMTFNQAARSAARAASALPRAANYQDSAASAVEGAVSTLIEAEAIDYLTIYKADPATGNPVEGTVKTCSTTCYRFTWNPATRKFVPVPGAAWPPSQQQACGGLTDTDYVGVYLEGRYEFVTGFFGPGYTLTERSVMRLEPVATTAQCR